MYAHRADTIHQRTSCKIVCVLMSTLVQFSQNNVCMCGIIYDLVQDVDNLFALL